ncbi:hypothetical protein K438DRAFT_1812765 [Mycena galopus ATCC 62051]|nr:hypothetical protein K438DRAFT_1812765 [Mycena galopus ATCC 62051]
MSTPSDLTVLSQMFKNARQEDLAAVLAKEDNLDNTICSIRIATDQREPASWPQMIRRLAEGKHVWFIRPIGDGTKDSKPPPLTPPTPDVPTADSAHSKASGGKGHGGGTEPKAPLPASAAALRADADEVRAIFALGDVTVDDSMTDLQLAELLPLLQPVQLIDIDIEAPPNKAPSSAAVLVRNSRTYLKRFHLFCNAESSGQRPTTLWWMGRLAQILPSMA